MRPRLTAVDARGRSLFVTAGYGYDNRVGGTLNGAVAPDGLPFREALQSRRADVGATAQVPLQGSGSLSLRFAYANSSRRRDFGPGESENDGTSTGLLELTRSFESGTHITVIGSALQLDQYTNAVNNAFDHSWYTPGLFATTERDAGPVTISASARADAHPDAGVQITERLAVLTKPAEGWSVRASVGTGFAAASATTEETEATGLRAIRSGGALRPEKSVSATLDVNGELAGAELLVTFYGSQIAAVVHMAELPGLVGVATLRNANVDTRIGGVEALAVWRFSGGKFIATYGYANGSRPDATTNVRVAMPMLPRHRVGADLMLEKPGVYRAGLEGTWYGEQALDDNPYRTMSKPYLYTMALVARQFGSLEVVVNFENLLNVRQTDTDPLLRRTRGMAGRWTTDAWAPLEGFMANVAVRYRWE